MKMNYNDIPPLADVFLLLPEHKRIIQGESKRIGVTKEASNLRKGSVLLSVALIIYLVLVTILLIASPEEQFEGLIVGLIPAIVIAVALLLVHRRYQCLT